MVPRMSNDVQPVALITPSLRSGLEPPGLRPRLALAITSRFRMSLSLL